jgi:hypothetical protein
VSFLISSSIFVESVFYTVGLSSHIDFDFDIDSSNRDNILALQVFKDQAPYYVNGDGG